MPLSIFPEISPAISAAKVRSHMQQYQFEAGSRFHGQALGNCFLTGALFVDQCLSRSEKRPYRLFQPLGNPLETLASADRAVVCFTIPGLSATFVCLLQDVGFNIQGDSTPGTDLNVINKYFDEYFALAVSSWATQRLALPCQWHKASC